MKKPFRCGLVVGKFAPLHRGHELLIQRAIAECDEVRVISYANPEPAGCEAARRERWLATMFPQTRRLVVTDEFLSSLPSTWTGLRRLPRDSDDEEIHREFVARLCLEVFGDRVDAVFTSEDYGDPFAHALTRHFRSVDPTAPAVTHVCIDRTRQIVPISGTRLRADIHANRGFLSPSVYASFVRRVAVLGGESSGKSTLAVAVATALETRHVAEYGRELWETQAGKLSESDLLKIARVQIEREECAAAANVWIVCDTTPLTTLFYAHAMFGRADPVLARLAERSYDVTILCEPDFAFVQDGTRRDEAFRAKQHAWYQRELSERGIDWVTVRGTIEERVESVCQALRQRCQESQ